MEKFKPELIDAIDKIRENIKKGAVVSDDDLKKILLYSLIEEENNDGI